MSLCRAEPCEQHSGPGPSLTRTCSSLLPATDGLVRRSRTWKTSDPDRMDPEADPASVRRLLSPCSSSLSPDARQMCHPRLHRARLRVLTPVAHCRRCPPGPTPLRPSTCCPRRCLQRFLSLRGCWCQLLLKVCCGLLCNGLVTLSCTMATENVSINNKISLALTE
jgi:hypothetical protein